MQSHTAVADEICAQLGGRAKLQILCGADNFLATCNSLRFRLPGSGGFTKHGINFVRITLNYKDLYDVELCRVRGKTVTTVASHHDLYADKLKPTLEAETGLVFPSEAFTVAVYGKGNSYVKSPN